MPDGLFARLRQWFGGSPSEPAPSPMKTVPGSEMMVPAPPELDAQDEFRDEGNFRKRNDATPAAIMRR